MRLHAEVAPPASRFHSDITPDFGLGKRNLHVNVVAAVVQDDIERAVRRHHLPQESAVELRAYMQVISRRRVVEARTLNGLCQRQVSESKKRVYVPMS